MCVKHTGKKMQYILLFYFAKITQIVQVSDAKNAPLKFLYVGQ